MSTHLHLHLEPEERKRRSLDIPRPRCQSAKEFFAIHSLDRPDRLAVGREDLKRFLLDVHREQRVEGVGYVELRVSPRRFMQDGMTWLEFVTTVHEVLSTLDRPVLRAVLLFNRESSESFIAECTEHLEEGIPSSFVGIDLAGDETRWLETSRFRSLFEAGRSVGLLATVHAGEFGNSDGIWRALDELGAQRIGHALSATESSTLMGRLRDDRILVEVALGSNVALGAVAHVRDHPATILFSQGVHLCFNADVPLHTGWSLAAEIELAADLLMLDRDEVWDMQRKATSFAFALPSQGPYRSVARNSHGLRAKYTLGVNELA